MAEAIRGLSQGQAEGVTGTRQVRGNPLGKRSGDNPGDLFDAGRAKVSDAAKTPQQLLRRARAYALNIFSVGLKSCASPAAAGNPTANRWVSSVDQLDQIKIGEGRSRRIY